MAAFGAVVLMFLLSLAIHSTMPALGNVVRSDRAPANEYLEYDFFATSTGQTVFASTTTATSTNIATWTDANGRIDNGYFVISGAEHVTVFLQRGDTTGQGNVGTTTFKFQVSEDGTNWHDYNHLRDLGAETTADGWFTRVSSVTAGASDTNDAAATSTTAYQMDTDTLGWYALRAIVVEGTDGEHSVRASAQF